MTMKKLCRSSWTSMRHRYPVKEGEDVLARVIAISTPIRETGVGEVFLIDAIAVGDDLLDWDEELESGFVCRQGLLTDVERGLRGRGIGVGKFAHGENLAGECALVLIIADFL